MISDKQADQSIRKDTKSYGYSNEVFSFWETTMILIPLIVCGLFAGVVGVILYSLSKEQQIRLSSIYVDSFLPHLLGTALVFLALTVSVSTKAAEIINKSIIEEKLQQLGRNNSVQNIAIQSTLIMISVFMSVILLIFNSLYDPIGKIAGTVHMWWFIILSLVSMIILVEVIMFQTSTLVVRLIHCYIGLTNQKN